MNYAKGEEHANVVALSRISINDEVLFEKETLKLKGDKNKSENKDE